MKKIIWVASLVLLTLTGNVQAKELSKADIERIVHNYIVSNGGVVAQSVDTYLAEQRRETASRLVSSHSPTYGADKPQITFIEFSDFRCGYCKRVQSTITQLRKKYKDRVQFVFKNMPILSEESRQAALAGLAAHKQGKFWEFNTKMWEGQSRLGEDLFIEAAKSIGLNIKAFNKDRASEEIASQSQLDFVDGQASGVRGTPHFIIDGSPLSGAQPFEAFEQAIELALMAREKS